MTRSEYALDYTACSVDELKAFIKARTRKEVTANCAEEYFILRLQDLNRLGTFRFFDLPPELRNRVYRELLTWDHTSASGKTFCFPSILTTSRQAYDEAKDMLYTENVARIYIVAEIAPQYAIHTAHGICTLSINPALKASDPPRSIITKSGQWPIHLRKFERVQISNSDKINRAKPLDAQYQSAWKTNATLYHLINSLLDSSKLKTVNVEMKGTFDLGTGCGMMRILWPLAKLRAMRDNVNIIGLAQAVLLELEQQSKQYAFSWTSSLTARITQLEHRIQEYRHLAQEVGFKIPESPLINCHESVIQAVEESFIIALDDAEAAFCGPEMEALKAAVSRNAEQELGRVQRKAEQGFERVRRMAEQDLEGVQRKAEQREEKMRELER